ncbi:hypothetical protein HK405_002565, partial [Cladochytrium tenue]
VPTAPWQSAPRPGSSHLVGSTSSGSHIQLSFNPVQKQCHLIPVGQLLQRQENSQASNHIFTGDSGIIIQFSMEPNHVSGPMIRVHSVEVTLEWI